jgi:hypothetical protein
VRRGATRSWHGGRACEQGRHLVQFPQGLADVVRRHFARNIPSAPQYVLGVEATQLQGRVVNVRRWAEQHTDVHRRQQGVQEHEHARPRPPCTQAQRQRRDHVTHR